jgi:HTH-type transcriptional regulator, glycine betaine synthesis regulator
MPAGSDRDAALDRFVTAWSGLASLFGFNPSTARVSALLIGAAAPLSLSEIAERLGISRGNASMCLKELRAWGVAQKVAQPADRQDWYVSRGDLFRQTISIARQRKRREFDPVAEAALAALGDLERGASPEQAARIREIEEYLTALERIGREVLDDEKAALALIELLRRSFGRPQERG